MEWLVTKAKKGDKDAFLKLVEERVGILYKIAYGYFKNSHDASDAVQDSILMAFKGIKGLKDEAKFNPWITSILVNRCKDILRKNKKIQFEEYCDEIVSSSRPLEDSYLKVETNIDILRALGEIDEIYKDVIALKYLGDLSIKEIATALGIPEGTVKSRLSNGIKKLKAIMEVKEYEMQRSAR